MKNKAKNIKLLKAFIKRVLAVAQILPDCFDTGLTS